MAIEIINLAVALFLLWAFVYFCYRDYRLDQFREEIFIVRAELFEYAASGAIPFNSPAYTLLREFMNQVIRYAHALTFSRFLIVRGLDTLQPHSRRDGLAEWRAAVANLQASDVRNKLTEFHNRVALPIAGQLIKRSVFLFSAALLLALIQRLVGSGRKPEEMVRKELERVESQVVEVGEQDHDSQLVTA